MKNKMVFVMLISVMPIVAVAQDASKQAKHKHKTTTKKTTKIPEWAAAHNYDAASHVYFPDYYAFYDPNRGGYMYWEKGNWNFTPTVPPYMSNADLNKSRVQILKGLSLDMHPEEHYPYYMEMYPPDPNNNSMIPVPNMNNPAGN